MHNPLLFGTMNVIIENKHTDIKFTHNIEELLTIFTSSKGKLVRFLKKHFKKDIHYIVNKNIVIGNHGGHNKLIYMLTEETIELIKNTFNLKHRYITKISSSRHVNIIMSLENQTIGFIENSFKYVVDVIRQKTFKNEYNEYRVDLYFPEYNLIVECDENNHTDRDPTYEKIRENYLLSIGNNLIRFNPNDTLFDLSFVFREINKILFSKDKEKKSLINVEFK